jgi:DNA-3-methyladenine glycosylase II
LDGRDVLVELVAEDGGGRPSVRLTVRGERVDDALLDTAAARIRRSFSLDVDPAPFLALASEDAVLSPIVQTYRDLRLILVPDPFEALIWAVVGQQINVAFARKLKAVLVELCGRTLVVDGQPFRLAPLPEDIAALDPATLATRQFSRQKAGSVIGLGQAVAEGRLNLEALASIPDDEAIAELTRHRGVGRWTAEYVLMRGLGARDVIPAGDSALKAVIGRGYHLGRSASEQEVRAIAERWVPWRSWAAFFWWFSLQARHFP